jgi:hypothetical protein
VGENWRPVLGASLQRYLAQSPAAVKRSVSRPIGTVRLGDSFCVIGGFGFQPGCAATAGVGAGVQVGSSVGVGVGVGS